MIKWRTKVELRYYQEDVYEETHYVIREFILGVFDNENDAQSIADEFYDNTKHLYTHPWRYSYGKHTDMLTISESSTKANTGSVTVSITTTPMNFIGVNEVIEHLEQEILKHE